MILQLRFFKGILISTVEGENQDNQDNALSPPHRLTDPGVWLACSEGQVERPPLVETADPVALRTIRPLENHCLSSVQGEGLRGGESGVPSVGPLVTDTDRSMLTP